MVPWKELTDRFDQIQDWMDGLRERVRKDISDLEQEDENSPNMSDYVVHLKVRRGGGILYAISQNTTQNLTSPTPCNYHLGSFVEDGTTCR